AGAVRVRPSKARGDRRGWLRQGGWLLMGDAQRFTVVLDFRGGTYLAQVEAEGCVLALERWAAGLDVAAIYGMGPKLHAQLKRALLERVQGSPPVLVEGLVDVWCVSTLLGGHLALIHVVGCGEVNHR
ncbi:MAG: hypothetical protein KC492_19240, partial [Myxococcales bacterium]|nr:hypothetical protein [Myxococcales bacterium]